MMNKNVMENWLFSIYVFTMPFTNFHPLGLDNTFGAMAKSPAFLISIVGMFLLLVKNRGILTLDGNGLFCILTKSVIALNIISIIMAVILYGKLGVLGGETAFDAIAGDIVYWIQVLFIVLFNIILIRKVDIKVVKNILEKLIYVLLIIGYIEMLMILIGGPFISISNTLYHIGLIYNPVSMLNTGKVFLTYSEASYAEIALGALIWPYLCSGVLVKENSGKSIILLLATLPIAVINQSSSVLLALGIYMILLVYYICRSSKTTRKQMIFFMLVTVIITIVLLLASKQIIPLFIEKVIKKPFDKNDYSTIQRSSVIRNCILTFLEYPVFGVGNGNQGYFYKGHLTANAYRSYEVQETLKFRNGVPSAGSWFGGILSGYGIVGVIFLVLYIVNANRVMKKIKGTRWYYVYFMTGICFLVCSWFTASLVGEYLQILFLSIPFLIRKEKLI